VRKYLLAILSVIILALVAWGFYATQIPTLSIEDNFVRDGVVIKDNPGFKPGVWFLSYEEPGSPGLSVELDLNSVSAPYISLTQGERVHVEGILRGLVVTVRSITSLSAETGMPIKLY
jgi:hypothetical protein